MPDDDQRPDDDFDELEHAKGVNFRDYPSSGFVVVAAALSSGLGWMLYKWLGRKRAARSADSPPSEPASGSAPNTDATKSE